MNSRMITRGQLNSLLLTIAAITLMLLSWQLYQLFQTQRLNQQLIEVSQSVGIVETPQNARQNAEWYFTYGYQLRRNRLYDAAAEAYGHAERYADSPEQLSHIYYNLGNIYLLQAIDLAEDLVVNRAMAMADVAKDFYKSALRQNPDFWAAKYNFEAAQRLSRDLPLGEAVITDPDAPSSEDLWSAMPGFPIGLP
ncbi:MxaK protein [Methylophaga lonarensis MPL]|uniref:MxaK protein n=1 Tax=Methylophaga lonarensis MPL TaxID=1286106 RepID=M7NYX1_9GAMM|nr:hypothetical protein [Methylophaga lonarensis]EMR12406.1 MxaK protein [Methylophaga lonarensis MPL]